MEHYIAILLLQVVAYWYGLIKSRRDGLVYLCFLVCAVVGDACVASGYRKLAVVVFAISDVHVQGWAKGIKYEQPRQKIVVALTVGISALLSYSIYVAVAPASAYWGMFALMTLLAWHANKTSNYWLSLAGSSAIVYIAWEQQWQRWPFFVFHGLLSVAFYVRPQLPGVLRVNTVRLRRELTEDKYI